MLNAVVLFAQFDVALPCKINQALSLPNIKLRHFNLALTPATLVSHWFLSLKVRPVQGGNTWQASWRSCPVAYAATQRRQVLARSSNVCQTSELVGLVGVQVVSVLAFCLKCLPVIRLTQQSWQFHFAPMSTPPSGGLSAWHLVQNFNLCTGVGRPI